MAITLDMTCIDTSCIVNAFSFAMRPHSLLYHFVGVVLGFIFHNANKLPNVLGYGNWVDPAEQWVATPPV